MWHLFVQIRRCVFMFWFKFWFWNSFLYILFESSCCISIWNFGIGLLRIANVEFLIPPFFFWLHCMAYRSLLIAPEQRIEPRPTAVKMLNPNHWTAREIPLILHLNISAYSFILILFIEAIPAYFQKLKHISHKINRNNQCQLFGI